MLGTAQDSDRRRSERKPHDLVASVEKGGVAGEDLLDRVGLGDEDDGSDGSGANREVIAESPVAAPQERLGAPPEERGLKRTWQSGPRRQRTPRLYFCLKRNDLIIKS